MTVERSSDAIEHLVDDAKLYAALSGTFDPRMALPAEARSDPDTIVAVASELATRCDTNPDSGKGWLLRTAERQHVLRQLGETGKLHDAIERRRASDIDPATDDLLLALEGVHPFAPEDIEKDLREPPSEERIERIIVALDRAGESAPAYGLLPNARSTLAQMQREARRQQLRERGFFGRHGEKERLLKWLERPQEPPVRAAFLSGLPGIGKSALLEEMVGIANDEFDSLNVRLDFDRAGLNVLDLLGLTMEVARQVADRLGEAGKPLLEARLAAASVTTGEEAISVSRQAAFPRELALAIGEGVRRANRPVMMVLDTLEVLRARGERHPIQLFKWIDELVTCGVRPLRVIAAGRGDAFDSCSDRVGVHISLEGLDREATSQFLEQLKVVPHDRDAVIDVAAGNPLVLRLAADVVNRFGTASLPRRQLDKEVAAAFLYRFLVSRIEDPQLRKLAHPGLIVRRISAEVLRDVLAPALGLPDFSETQAGQLFDSLASEHWLVIRDPLDPHFVTHRSDMRLVLLPLLYREEPALCARVDAAAVTWFGKRDDPASQVDAAYHRLQLMRTRKAQPMISSAIAHQFDDQMIAELPEQAQEIVIRARGSRSTSFRGATPGPSQADDEGLVREILILLDRQDWAEGQYVVGQAVNAGGFDARSRAADAVRAFWWGAGRWDDARRLLSERDALGSDDRDLGDLPQPLMVARLEMRAEFNPRRLRPVLSSPIFENLAGELVGSAVSLARHGALAFWIATRNEQLFRDAGYGKDVEPVAAALEQWGGRDGHAARLAIDNARERLASRGGSISPQGPSVAAQLLAAHSPYVRYVATLATQEGYDWLTEAAARADERLSQAGGLFNPPLDCTLTPLSSSPIAGIAGLGLFAEWLEVLAFHKRDANLRSIGRAAERWRQTMAGSWQYGRPPSGWPVSVRIDHTVSGRIEALLSTKPAADAARSQLALWLDGQAPDPDGALRILERRMPRILRDGAGVASPLEKAATLLRWNVPAAFIPPLAVLLTNDKRSARRKGGGKAPAPDKKRPLHNSGSKS